MAEIRPLLKESDKARLLDEFAAVLRTYTALGQEIMAKAVSGKPAEAIETLKTKSKPVGAVLEKIATQLTEYEQAQMTDSHNQVVRAREFVAGLIVIALCLGAAVFLAVAKVTHVLRSTARKITDVSEQVHAAAKQISRGGTLLAEGVSEQAASLEQTSASSNQISAMANKGAENCQAASEAVAEADRKTKQALLLLEQMVASMQQMDASSAKTSRIIKVIDEIAFQTNILALNSAVEAARAGAASAGFAVVANEVRNRAQRCTGAAWETAELIESSVAHARDGLVRVDQVSRAIRDSAASAATLKLLVEAVSAGSQEQSQGISQISRAIVEVEQVTQSSPANAEETAAASHEMFTQSGVLRHMAAKLRELVEVAPRTV